MSFGKYTLYSVYAITENGTMSSLGFAMLFFNKDKESWTHFWKFIKKTDSGMVHASVGQKRLTHYPIKSFLGDQ